MRLTGRLIGRGLAVALFVGGSCVLAACDRIHSTAARISHAEAKIDLGGYGSAAADLRIVLEREPQNPTALIVATRLALQLGDVDGARQRLDQARAAGAPVSSTRELEVRVLLAQRKYADVLTKLKDAASIPEPQRLVYVATAFAGLGEKAQVEEALDAAMRLAPTDPVVGVAWAKHLIMLNRLADADSVIDGVLARYPGTRRAWVVKAVILHAAGKSREARDALLAAVKPGSHSMLLAEQTAALAGAAEFSLSLGDVAGADLRASDLKAVAPHSLVAEFMTGRVAYAKHDYVTAINALQAGVRVDPNHGPTRLLLGTSLLAAGNLEQAQVAALQLLTDEPTNAAARNLLAAVYLARNHPADASRVLSEAPGLAPPNMHSEWLLGQALFATGSFPAAVDHLERAASADPTNAAAQTDLARAYLATGELVKGRAVLDAIAPERRDARTAPMLLYSAVADKDFREAAVEVDRLVAANAADSNMLAAAGNYFARHAEPARARELLEKAVRVQPGNSAARLAIANLDVLAGQPDSAAAQLRTLLKSDVRIETAYLQLADIETRRGDRKAAEAWLEKSIGTIPEAVQSRLTLARLTFLDREPVRARALLDQAQTIAKFSPAIMNAVGVVLLQAEQYDDALAKFSEAAAQGLPEASLNAARTHVARGHNELAIRMLDEALRANPNFAGGISFLTAVDTNDVGGKRGLDRVAAFRAAGGTSPVADELEGDVLFAAHRFAAAASKYSQAARGSRASELALKIFRANGNAGQTHPEEALLARLRDAPREAFVRTALAEYYAAQGDRHRAIAEYERLAAAGAGNDAAILNNLAWQYMLEGDPRALPTAQKAYEGWRGMPQIADTYGWLLVRSGKAAAAIPILEAAGKQASNDDEIQYHLAAAYAGARDATRAATVLRALLESPRQFAERGDAQSLLNSLDK